MKRDTHQANAGWGKVGKAREEDASAQPAVVCPAAGPGPPDWVDVATLGCPGQDTRLGGLAGHQSAPGEKYGSTKGEEASHDTGMAGTTWRGCVASTILLKNTQRGIT